LGGASYIGNVFKEVPSMFSPAKLLVTGNVVAVLGLLSMLLSGEIFFKVMMALTGGSFTIAVGMALTVEGGKYFLTKAVTGVKIPPFTLWLYRGLKAVMVIFSLMASLFFFSQFLGDKSGMAKAVAAAQMGVNTEYDRRTLVLKENLKSLESRESELSSKVLSVMNGRDRWVLGRELKATRTTLEQERQKLSDKLVALESERASKLEEVAQPSKHTSDERARNPQMNAMVSTLRGGGLPVNYNILLFSFCALISVFLEAMIHVTAALPVSKKSISLTKK
jgi:hypothetical protein